MENKGRCESAEYKSITNLGELTQSVIGAPVKSRIRVLFCCRIEASPFVAAA